MDNIIITLLAVSAGIGFNDIIQRGEILEHYGRIIERLPEWLSKPLGACPECFAGQMALWFGFFYPESYDFVLHLTTIFTSITIVKLIEKHGNT